MEFIQQFRLGRIELATVVTEVEFCQVQAEGAGLRQEALDAAVGGSAGFALEQTRLDNEGDDPAYML